MSTSKTPAITFATIQQLITDSITTALEAQAATMANADNPIVDLPRRLEENVTTSKPQTLEEATNIAHRLMNKIIKHDFVQETNDHKRKLKDKGNIINNNNYQNNYNNNNHNNDYHQQQNKKQETFRTYAAANGYTGNRPLCEKCTLHHIERKDIMRMSAQKQTTNPQESILRDKLAFVHFMISTLETTLEDI
ncbi:hypothetical protein Tco_0245438 [Tanacetum coccineum]